MSEFVFVLKRILKGEELKKITIVTKYPIEDSEGKMTKTIHTTLVNAMDLENLEQINGKFDGIFIKDRKILLPMNNIAAINLNK